MPRLSGSPGDYIVAKLRINYGNGGGWVEKYNLATTNRATAAAILTGLVQYRYAILAGNFSIPWATASQQSILRDSITPIKMTFGQILLQKYPSTYGNQESTPELCNNAESGLSMTFESNLGVAMHRVFRGIRDSWQSDEWELSQGLTIPVSLTGAWAINNNPVAPANGASPAQALAAFLGFVGDNTCFIQPGKVGSGKSAYMGGISASFNTYFGGFIRVRHIGKGWSARRDRKKRPI